MRINKIFLFIVLIFGILSCSSESIKRTGYKTLQNINEQQCEKELSSKCQERENYDEYQRKRKNIMESS